MLTVMFLLLWRTLLGHWEENWIYLWRCSTAG